MAKKILAIVGVVGSAVSTANVSAQPTGETVIPTCALDPRELAQAPGGDELLARQASLQIQRNELARELDGLSPSNIEGRKRLEDRIELNGIALSYVQQALSSFAKRQENLRACESALKRWTLVNQIAAPAGTDTLRQRTADAAVNSADTGQEAKQVALRIEASSVAAKLGAAKKSNNELIEAEPSVAAYARLSLGDAFTTGEVRQAPSRSGDLAGAGSASPPTDPCARMIEQPAANLLVGDCGSSASLRSARSYGGGDVAFPSSVLKPRGLTANLTGSSSDGTVSITYADSFKRRLTPKVLPDNPEDRVQLPVEIGYSFGVKAKDGVLFSRDDVDKSIRDNIDGKASISAGLFFNAYDGETLKEWNARGAKLNDTAMKACRKDQAGGESKTPSTCTGQSLTDWVFAVTEDGSAYLHPEIAKQADDLYFRSSDDKPVAGIGVNFTLAHSQYDYLDPVMFVGDPASKNQSDSGWNWATTGFAYGRVNPSSSKYDVSLIGSVTRTSNFGYPEGTKAKQFCPPVIVGTPFVTGGCPSYYTAAPERLYSWTPAAELRILTPRFGPIPSLGISPKLSFEEIDDSTADRWRVDFPVLVLVDEKTGFGVGMQYTREAGGYSDIQNAAGSYDELKKEDKLTLVVTKSFSLTDF